MNALERENEKLRHELQLCTEERDRLRALQPFKRGLQGERYIADLLTGDLTDPNARQDVITKTGQHLEIKLGGLRVPVPGEKTKQWAWSHLLGADGRKQYDRLILLGPVDERFRGTDGPYVIFDIPYAEVVAWFPRRTLLVSSNPNRVQSSVSAILWKYLTNEADMKRKYCKA